MADRAELFVRDDRPVAPEQVDHLGRELSDGEAAHLLNLARRSKNPTVQRRAMLLFASFQGQSVAQIALTFQDSATHVALASKIHR